ncbi:MAG: EAL domain-containing protein [Pseudomonadota bacterium]
MPEVDDNAPIPYRPRDWFAVGALTVAIFCVIWFSYAFGLAGQTIAAIWPAAGVSFWAVLRYGLRGAVAVYVGHFLYSLLMQNIGALGTTDLILVTSAANALGSVIAASAYRRFGGTLQPFASLRQTLLLIFLTAPLLSMIAATAGAPAVSIYNGFSAGVSFDIWQRWLLSDLTGVILMMPLMVALLSWHQEGKPWHWRDEPVLPIAGFGAILVLLFTTHQLAPAKYLNYLTVLLTMPYCAWLAFKAQSRMCLALLPIMITTTMMLELGSLGANTERDFLLVQLYGAVVLSTSLVLLASNAERGRATRALARERNLLEERVQARTAALQAMADTDPLTGLANRRSFNKVLESAYRQSRIGHATDYLLYIDLDRFKIVNDTSGHSAGDALLQLVADLIKGQASDTDTVARLGGDEFAVLLYSRHESEAQRIAEKIRIAIDEQQFAYEGEIHGIGASIGLIVMDANSGTLQEHKQKVDAACYTAKSQGRNRVHLVTSDDSYIEHHRGEVRWAKRIDSAIKNNGFVLYGQAIVPADGVNDGPEQIEVLLRLRDRERRQFIGPNQFLPAAERYGLATRIDEWVVQNVIKTIYVHDAFDANQRQYWINLSGSSIGDRQFVQMLIDTMENSPVEPGLINFEITETAVIGNIGEAIRLMGVLHDLGCKFALDDFGTGLSSFAHLKRLPVDHLKIDGQFIRDVVKQGTDQVIVQSIIDIAHSLGLKAVAEYVENEEILAVIREMGVDYIQGFGIHSPEPLMPSFKDSIIIKSALEPADVNLAHA